MRASVGTRGAAGSTFDHVAREAGVSRGLLHYYFGSKERLLVEVVRHDCEVRIAAMERADRAGRRPSTRSSPRSCVGLEEFIEGEPGSQAVIYEMLSASRHSEEIRAELAELYRRWRARPGRRAARARSARASSAWRPTPSRWPRCCSALGDGFGIQVLSDPDWDREAAFELGVRIARRLLGADRVADRRRVERLPALGARGRRPVAVRGRARMPIPISTAVRAADDRDPARAGPRARDPAASARRTGRGALLVMGEGRRLHRLRLRRAVVAERARGARHAWWPSSCASSASRTTWPTAAREMRRRRALALDRRATWPRPSRTIWRTSWSRLA